jgi:CBS domain containing-hemolysin-like protein
MGSSSPALHAFWLVLAVSFAVLYLVFDTARHFVQQLGPVRLRRLSGNSQTERGRWFQYDPENINLVSGAILQIALVGGVAASILAAQELSIQRAVLYSSIGWIGLAIVWKFVLGMIPDEAGAVILRALIPVSHFFFYLFFPILSPLRRLVARMDRDVDAAEETGTISDEEVQAFIDVGEEEGILEEAEGKLIQSIVDFGDRMARELMTPRIEMEAFDARRPIEELAQMFSESKYSRIPIYAESIDAITGIVHIKDIFDNLVRKDQRTVIDLARPPYFVSETKKVSELLREFQVEHIELAVVVDEYGGTAGLITIEDIVEDVFGDISDEHEDEEATIADLGGDTYLVSGLLRVEQLEEVLDAQLQGKDYETVAGLIFTTLGRVPEIGTVVRKNGFRFEVERADRRRIYRVKVSPDPEWTAEQAEAAE